MLNVTAAEMTALAAHFHAEIHDGFTAEVKIAKAALAEGDNQLTQDAFLEISGVTHRSLERHESGDADWADAAAYRALNVLADKLTAYEDESYRSGAWA